MKGIIKIYSAKIFLKKFLITKKSMRGVKSFFSGDSIKKNIHKMFTSGVNVI